MAGKVCVQPAALQAPAKGEEGAGAALQGGCMDGRRWKAELHGRREIDGDTM